MKKIILYMIVLFVLSSFVYGELTHYWNFENNFIDQVGSNDGINNGTNFKLDTPTFNKSGTGGTYSLYSTGFYEYAQFGKLTDIKSFSLWFKPNETVLPNDKQGFLISGSLQPQRNPEIWLGDLSGGIDDELISFIPISGSNYFYWNTSNLVLNNLSDEWHNLIIMQNLSDGNTTLYYDGINKGIGYKEGTGTQNTTFDNFAVTANYTDPDQIGAYVDEIRMYNDIILPEQAEQIFNYGYILFDNFSIRARNKINYSPISNFSAYIEGVGIFDSNITFKVIHTNLTRDATQLFNITIFAPGYLNQTYYNYNVSLSNIFTDLSPEDSINITFIDELTWQPIIDRNISFEAISDIYSENFTITDGSLKLAYIYPTNYIFRYSGENYTERLYFITLEDNETTDLSLYLLDNASATEVKAVVYDESNNKVEDVNIKMLKFDIGTNTYRIVESASTNFLGEAYLDVELASEFYKFILDYGGTTRKVTNATYIYETILNFQINTGDDIGGHFQRINDVDGSLTFNNNTNYMTFVFNDPDGVLYKGCLTVYTLNIDKRALYNKTCAYGSAGTISIYLNPINGTTYQGVATVGFNPDNEYWGSMEIPFLQRINLGNFGMFLLVLLTAAVVFIGYWSLTLAVIITPLPLILFSFAGLVNFNPYVAISIEIVALIIAYIISDRS